MSKYHIVGNLMPGLNYINSVFAGRLFGHMKKAGIEGSGFCAAVSKGKEETR